MLDQTEIPCTYYGSLTEPLQGDNLGVFLLDEAFTRVVEKHEAKLEKIQDRIIARLKATFDTEIKEFYATVRKLDLRITELEKAKYRKK